MKNISQIYLKKHSKFMSELVKCYFLNFRRKVISRKMKS